MSKRLVSLCGDVFLICRLNEDDKEMSGDKMKLIEKSDRWIIPLNGKAVTQIRIDFGFTLHFWEIEGTDVVIRIEGEFTYKTNESEYKIKPGENLSKLCPALELFQKKIHSAEAYKNGILKLAFEDNIFLVVKEGQQYEPWELAETNGSKLISLPGGELAVYL